MMVSVCQLLVHICLVTLLGKVGGLDSGVEVELAGQLVFNLDDETIFGYFDSKEGAIRAINNDFFDNEKHDGMDLGWTVFHLKFNSPTNEIKQWNGKKISEIIFEKSTSDVRSQNIINVFIKHRKTGKYLTVDLNSMNQVFPNLEWKDNPQTWYFVQSQSESDELSSERAMTDDELAALTEKAKIQVPTHLGMGERVYILNNVTMRGTIESIDFDFKNSQLLFGVSLDDNGTILTLTESEIDNLKNGHFEIGTKIDAYWPADRLKKTKLANVLWPGIVKSYTRKSDTYTIEFEDNTMTPHMPSIWVKPRMECVDTRKDCPKMASNGQCRLNPQFTMVYCRMSCGVCTPSDDKTDGIENGNANGIENEEKEFPHLGIDFDETEWQLKYSQVSDSFEESEALNEMGQRLLRLGNISLAESYFKRSALLGNSDSQFQLGHIYSIKNEIDKSLLYYFYGASTGSLEATMALGYRHLKGYGVPKSCQVSCKYYKSAAETQFSETKLSHHIEMIALNDRDRRDSPMEESDDIIKFYQSKADNGDAEAQLALGQLYYYGVRGFEQNIDRALQLFEMAAQQNEGEAHAMIGNIYAARAQESSQEQEQQLMENEFNNNNDKEKLYNNKNASIAVNHYQQAMELNNMGGYSGMGFLYLEGIGVKRNRSEAMRLFKKAAQSGDPTAQFYLGLMYFNGIGVSRSYESAFSYFMAAAARGHGQALYYAGHMHLHGITTAKSCKMAVQLFKLAAERTIAAKQLQNARKYYLAGDYDRAFILYSIASEQGFEIAQSNAGWLLKRQFVEYPLKWFEYGYNNTLYSRLNSNNDNNNDSNNVTSDESIHKKILSDFGGYRYFRWSADQENPNSQRIVGDYYYYLLAGIEDKYLLQYPNSKDENRKNEKKQNNNSGHYTEAANYYQFASENVQKPDSQAKFNLGYMHQHGLGRKKDFEMAKRYYDAAMINDHDATVPCYLALGYLYWNKLFSNSNDDSNFNLPSINILSGINFPPPYVTQFINRILDADFENMILTLLIILLALVIWIRQP